LRGAKYRKTKEMTKWILINIFIVFLIMSCNNKYENETSDFHDIRIINSFILDNYEKINEVAKSNRVNVYQNDIFIYPNDLITLDSLFNDTIRVAIFNFLSNESDFILISNNNCDISYFKTVKLKVLYRRYIIFKYNYKSNCKNMIDNYLKINDSTYIDSFWKKYDVFYNPF